MRYLVLNPGHGGTDRGTSHNNVVESEYVYDLALAVEKALAALGFGCLLTRGRDEDPSHHARAKVALDHMAAGTVCIHVNASHGGDPREHGPLAFHRDDDLQGEAAARAFVRSLGRSGEFTNTAGDVRKMLWQTHIARPPRHWTCDAWSCIVQNPLPVVLVECEYCTHEPSARWLLSPEGKAALTRAIVAAAQVLIG